MKFLKPTKKKIILSLMPFVPVLLMPSFLVEIPFSFPFAGALMSMQLFVMIFAYGIILLMAFPLKPILAPLGMWEYHSSLFIMASGPEVSVIGMILTASFYSGILYLLISFLSKEKSKSHQTYCIECEKEKTKKYCDECQKETGNLFKITLTEEVRAKESLGIEQRRFGIKKYIKKIFQGYQTSINKKRHPDGVDRLMNIDREKNWYDEVVKDNTTGKIFREVHEPLSEHVADAQKTKNDRL